MMPGDTSMLMLTANGITSRRTIVFTCVQCGHTGSSEAWSMTCPRCWVPMVAGMRETWWPKNPAGGRKDGNA